MKIDLSRAVLAGQGTGGPDCAVEIALVRSEEAHVIYA